MSAAASSDPDTACPPGYRDDNFMLYANPIPCSLNVAAHKGMFIAWTVFFAACVLEHLIATFRRTNQHATRVQITGYFAWLLSLLVMCSYVVGRNFEVAVGSSVADSVVIWVSFGVANGVVVVTILNGVASFAIAIISLLGVTDASRKTHRLFINMFYMVMLANAIVCFVTLCVLVQVLSDPEQRDVVANAFSLAYGSAVFTYLGGPVAVYVEMLCRRCAEQIKFLSKSPNPDVNAIKKLHGANMRLRLIQVIGTVDIYTPILYFVIGAYLRWRYEMIHVILSATCVPVVFIALLHFQSPLLRFIWSRDLSTILKKLGLASASSAAASEHKDEGAEQQATSAEAPTTEAAIDLLQQTGRNPTIVTMAQPVDSV